VRRRLRELNRDGGFTIIELLVASALGVVVMGGVATLLITAVRDQPRISKQAQNVTTARYVLDRMTHELRNGIVVKKATASEVSFEGYVRHNVCGGTGTLASGTGAIRCRLTYACTVSACTRNEVTPGGTGGTTQTLITGINSSSFTYEPNAAEATYVKVTLRLPNPSGTGALTISNGASLRNATLGY
jgi:prepilin-type N-terminal cleavage/methylation domain-containing protein